MKFYILRWQDYVCNEHGHIILPKDLAEAWIEFTPAPMQEFLKNRSLWALTMWSIVELDTNG